MGFFLGRKAMPRKPFAKFARVALVVLAVAAVPSVMFVYQRIRPALMENDLIAACQSGDTKSAEQLLDEGVDPNHLYAGYGWSIANALAGRPLHNDDLDRYPPLRFAVDSGRTEIVKILVAHGADVNVGNAPRDGMPPLMIAVVENHVDIARILVAHGANVNARYKDGSTIWDNRPYPYTPALAKILLAAGAKPSE